MNNILLLAIIGLVSLTYSKNVKTDYENIANYINSLNTTWKV